MKECYFVHIPIMKHVHHKLGKVHHALVYPLLIILVIGIALLLVYIQKPGSEGQQILKQWADDPTQSL